jgi:Protein of unknown function (DUF2591)
MEIKVQDLIGIALDWAATIIEDPDACQYGVADWREHRRHTVVNGEYVHRYHQSWAQAGPIIEQEEISIRPSNSGDGWTASMWTHEAATVFEDGPTPLIAAMRCYVASKLGDEIDIPDELI